MRKRWHEVIDRLPHGPATLVEVGVWRGALSARLLPALPHLQLVLVDPWLCGAANMHWRDSGALLAQSPQSEMDAIYLGVVGSVNPYRDRVRVLRMSSLEAAADLPDGSCDAVFIDADHSAVEEDIRAWWPKVRHGGWIGGHDYGYPRFPGVAVAVDSAFPNVQRGADWTWFAPR